MNYRNGESLGDGVYINAASLLLEFKHFIDDHPVLIKINQANPSWPKLILYCELLEQYPDLMRSLTLLNVESQLDFERALFCSWGSLMVARGLNLPEPHQQALFLAGLFQDLGKYVVEMDINQNDDEVNRPKVLQPHGETEDYTHPLVSSAYLERMLPKVEGLAELVLYHHARDDGTGYPGHISESQLALDSQILILANEISDRLDRLGGHNQLVTCFPCLKISALLYFKKAHAGWIRLIEPHIEQTEEFTDVGRAFLILKSKKDRLEKLLSNLLGVSGELLHYDFDLKVHGLRATIQKLTSIMIDTGILDQQTLQSTEQTSIQGLQDINMIFRGIPDVLERCLVFVDTIMLQEPDTRTNMLSEARHLLKQTIRELDGRSGSIFR